MKITQELLKECFTYNDKIGTLEYIGYAKYCNKPIDKLVKHHSGYLYVWLFGKSYALHRLVWIWHNGEIPGEYTIDHKSRNRADNRISNLRLATAQQQAANRTKSSIGNIFVCNDGRKAKYRGNITFKYKKYAIKGCKTREEAEELLRQLHNKMIKEIPEYGQLFTI